jgi:hypothetical protein
MNIYIIIICLYQPKLQYSSDNDHMPAFTRKDTNFLTIQCTLVNHTEFN